MPETYHVIITGAGHNALIVGCYLAKAKTPFDVTRYNNALVECDIQHIGFYSGQLGGNRPVPGWSRAVQ